MLAKPSSPGEFGMSIWEKLAAGTELAIGGRIGALLDGMKGNHVIDPIGSRIGPRTKWRSPWA
jgi:hypothetical protein